MKYVAFLRAINVGGNIVIRMADLREMFESIGLENVQTYIQSGNVIFESSDKATLLETRIEHQLEETVSSRIQVFVRTWRAIHTIAGHSPFTPREQETVHVVFLHKKPDVKQRQAILALRSEADDFAVKGREIYNLRQDREKSIFSNNFIEKTLKMPGTTRNLTTIQKIAEKYK